MRKLKYIINPEDFRIKKPSNKVNESFTTDDIMSVITRGGTLTAKFVLNKEDHKENDILRPVDIDNDGNIAIIINGSVYYTKVKWVTSHKISENITYINLPEPVKNGRDIEMDSEDEDKVDDSNYQELLKDQGGVKGVIKMLKKHKGIDYSSMENSTESELYLRLKEDGLLQ